MLEPDIIQRIRAIFLHPEPRVTIADAASILGWSRAEMNAAIRNGEIAVVESRGRKRIEMRELAAWAVRRWAVTTIEEALGHDAARILPPPLRTHRVTVRLPRYQIDALKLVAEDAREPVDAIVTRAVEDLPDLDRERLSRLVPGFAEAIAWPEESASNDEEASGGPPRAAALDGSASTHDDRMWRGFRHAQRHRRSSSSNHR